METNERNEKASAVKEVYERPQMEAIEMETEGILCGSNGEGFSDGGGGVW